MVEASTQLDDQQLKKSVIKKRSAIKYVVVVPKGAENGKGHQCVYNDPTEEKPLDHREPIDQDCSNLTICLENGSVSKFSFTVPTTVARVQHNDRRDFTSEQPESTGLKGKTKEKDEATTSKVEKKTNDTEKEQNLKKVEQENLKNKQIASTLKSILKKDTGFEDNVRRYNREGGDALQMSTIEEYVASRKCQTLADDEQIVEMGESVIYTSIRDVESMSSLGSRRDQSLERMERALEQDKTFIKVLDPYELRNPNCCVKIMGENYKATFNIGLDPTIDELIFGTLKDLNDCTCGRHPECVETGERSKKAENIVQSCYKVLRTLFETAQVIDETTSNLLIYTQSETDLRSTTSELHCPHPMLTSIKNCVCKSLKEPCNFFRKTIGRRTAGLSRKRNKEKSVKVVTLTNQDMTGKQKNKQNAEELRKRCECPRSLLDRGRSVDPRRTSVVSDPKVREGTDQDLTTNRRRQSAMISDGAKRRSRSMQTTRRLGLRSDMDEPFDAPQITPSDALLSEHPQTQSPLNNEPVEVAVQGKKITMLRQPYKPTAESLQLMQHSPQDMIHTPKTNTFFDDFSRRVRIISPYKTVRIQKEQTRNGDGKINIVLDSGQTVTVVDPTFDSWNLDDKATQIEREPSSGVPRGQPSKYVAILEPSSPARRGEELRMQTTCGCSRGTSAKPAYSADVQSYFCTTAVEPKFDKRIPQVFFKPCRKVVQQGIETRNGEMIMENFKNQNLTGENSNRSQRSEAVRVEFSKQIERKTQKKWANLDTTPCDVLNSNCETPVKPWRDNFIKTNQNYESVVSSVENSRESTRNTDINILKTIRASTEKSNVQFLNNIGQLSNKKIDLDTDNKQSKADRLANYNIIKSTSTVVYSKIMYVSKSNVETACC